jgi:DNA-binding transcriptional LysR family regulator
MDADLRKLRYFVAVAEQKHFGRATETLFVTQPVLSRQIKSLEKSLRCALFERSSRHVNLTLAGQQLLDDAPALLASFDATLRHVRQLGRGVERLAVAFAPGLRVSAAIRAFSADHPDVKIELFQVNWWEQDTPLRDGCADVAYLRRPFDDGGLHVVTVGSEPMVALMPDTIPVRLSGHRTQGLRGASRLGVPICLGGRRRRADSARQHRRIFRLRNHFPDDGQPTRA